MSHAIDLNADLGEGMPWDTELLARVSSANVSCGAHAGTPDGIASTLIEAGRRGVSVGAHPSWPDRDGFGRVNRSAPTRSVATLIIGQVAYLRSLAGPLGIAIRYVKPHGALYNQAMKDDAIAAGLVAGMRAVGLPLLGQPWTPAERLALAGGVPYLREGFPDRSYDPDGHLVPRGEPGALIEGVDEVVAQALRLVDLGLDSLCLHGDSPEAVDRADAIRAALDRRGIAVRSPLDHGD